MPTKEFQSAFNSGVLSKKAQSRVKIARYESGCKVCEHAIILPVGGATRRDGFRFAKETKKSTVADSILIPYDAGEDFTFMLEFGDLYMRVFKQDGTPGNTIGGPELITNGAFPTDILSWTDKSTGAGIFVWLPAFQRANLINPGPLDVAWMEQAITTVIGQTYQISFDREFNPGGGDFSLLFGITSGGAEIDEITLGTGSHTLQFVATATTTYIGFKQTGITNNQGNELVSNGLFDIDISGWTNQSTGPGSSGWSAGRLRTDSGGAPIGSTGGSYQAVATVIGKKYTVGWDFANQIHETNGFSEFRLGTTAGGIEIFSKNYTNVNVNGETHSFTATTTTIYIAFRTTKGSSITVAERSSWDNVTLTQGDFGTTVDNVTVKLADSPFELVTTIPQAELGAIQYAQLEDGMLLTSNGFKLQHLVPTAASAWTIVARDWENSKAILGATGTNIGDMTIGGGLAAGFDGDTLKTIAQAAGGAVGSFLVHLGKDWGVGVTKAIKGVNIWSSSDGNFWNESNVEMVVRVQASGDNFSSETVTLHESVLTIPALTVVTKLEIFNLNDIRTAYRYHRIEFEIKSSDASKQAAIAEMEFFEAAAENPPGLNDSSTTFAPAIGRIQQRSVTGGQKGRTATVYGTRSGDPLNMAQGEANPADGFQHELDSTSSIRWFIDTDGLLVGTSHGVTRLVGTQGALSATDKDAKADVAIGAAPILPAKLGNSALYVQTDRKRIQEATIPPNGVKLQASDMSQLADQIGDPTLGGSLFKGCAAQPDPHKVLWCFHDNGDLSGLTFDRQETLFGWHEHPMTNGAVISLAPLRGVDGRTEIWGIIKRTINGATKRSIEIMDPDIFSDGAVKYSGVPATTITGLGHLEGETVTVYGDGYNRGTFVVAAGQITINEEMTTGDIGLGFIPKLQPVSPIRGLGRKRRFGPVIVKVENTQSLWVNGKRQAFRIGADPMGAGVKFTGEKRVTVLGWSRQPTLTFEGREPGPWTILDYAGIMETGR